MEVYSFCPRSSTDFHVIKALLFCSFFYIYSLGVCVSALKYIDDGFRFIAFIQARLLYINSLLNPYKVDVHLL